MFIFALRYGMYYTVGKETKKRKTNKKKGFGVAELLGVRLVKFGTKKI